MSSDSGSSTEDLSKSSEGSCASSGSAVETKNLDYLSSSQSAASVIDSPSPVFDSTATSSMDTYGSSASAGAAGQMFGYNSVTSHSTGHDRA